MKIDNSYTTFLILVNKNKTNNNASVSKFDFITIFNYTINRYVEWILNKKNDDSIRYVSDLLVLEKPLVKTSSNTIHDEFEKPKDFFDHSNLTVYASSSSCNSVKLKTWEIKNDNKEEIYEDFYNKPSLKHRETFYHFSQKSVAIYKSNFKIDKALLSYYRYPRQVDIAGYTNLQNETSTNIDPELDDKVINRILIAMAKEFAANNNDPNQYQLNSNRLFESI